MAFLGAKPRAEARYDVVLAEIKARHASPREF